MATLADLEIGIGVKGLKSLSSDFDKVPKMADAAVDGADSKFAGLSSKLGDRAADAVDSIGNAFAGLAPLLAVGVAGAAAGAGAVLVSEFVDAMERERLGSKLGAQLDLSAADAKKAGKVAGDLYADAYGDSLGEVHDAVGQVMSSLGELDDGDVEDLTAKTLDLATAFEVDTGEAVTTVGVMLSRGLVRDADQGFDLITAAMQQVPSEMRGELLPILEEYSQDFAALGITGEDAFGILVDAAQDGRFALDKTADAVKEFTIRSTDMSAASSEAYEAIGLDAETMANKIVQGGDMAREGFGEVVAGLLAIEDPAEQANTAIALMGTPLEDLSVTEIPEFLRRMQEMDGQFGDTEGAAERMGDTLNDNVATDFEGFKRKAGAALDTFLTENVLPDVGKVIDAFEEDGVGGALDTAVALWEASQPKVQAWWDGTFTPFWEDTAVPWMKWAGGEMGVAMVNGLVQALVNGLARSLEQGGPIMQWMDEIGDQINRIPGMNVDLGGQIFDLPEFSGNVMSNPVSRPSGGGSRSLSSITAFHGGGYSPFGGMAELADKERVLSPRQTEAFDRLVDRLTVGMVEPGVALSGAGSKAEVNVYGLGVDEQVRRVATAVDDRQWQSHRLARV